MNSFLSGFTSVLVCVVMVCIHHCYYFRQLYLFLFHRSELEAESFGVVFVGNHRIFGLGVGIVFLCRNLIQVLIRRPPLLVVGYVCSIGCAMFCWLDLGCYLLFLVIDEFQINLQIPWLCYPIGMLIKQIK